MNATRVFALLILVWSGCSYAGDWYLSFGAHQADMRSDTLSLVDPDTGQAFEIRDNSRNTKFSVAAGYIINEYLAVEGSYVQLGEVGSIAPVLQDGNVLFTNASTEWQGVGIGAVGSLPLTINWKSYLTLGYSYINIEHSGPVGATFSPAQFIDSDSAVFYGLGVSREFGPNWDLAIEYKQFELDDSAYNSENLGLKLKYKF